MRNSCSSCWYVNNQFDDPRSSPYVWTCRRDPEVVDAYFDPQLGPVAQVLTEHRCEAKNPTGQCVDYMENAAPMKTKGTLE